MASGETDATIATKLNQQGVHTAIGREWTGKAVERFRSRNGLTVRINKGKRVTHTATHKPTAPALFAAVPQPETGPSLHRREPHPELGDLDGDGVVDDGDADRDGDGVTDQGVQDSDGNGIADCANARLHPEEPDSDGDGIIDRYDVFDNRTGTPVISGLQDEGPRGSYEKVSKGGTEPANAQGCLLTLAPELCLSGCEPDGAATAPRSGFGMPPFVPPRSA
ncbi:MAG: hypothetical protein HY259_07680 [Chloroflexi bacterium]|nr:hypothetical protein [Chloroflexota bacterium]